MSYDPAEKFNQPASGIVILSEGPTEEEVVQVQERIANGMDSAEAWAEVDRKVAERERKRKDSTAHGEVHVIVEP